MRNIYLILLIGLVLLSSCQKTISDFDPSTNPTGTPATPTTASGSFEATVDGQKFMFNIISATLLRSTADNEKRLDMAGVSADGKKRIIITLGEETSQGNAVTVKKYVLNAFPEDDPATPNIDESATTQGFTTYSAGPGNNNWITNVYDETGSFTVTSCDASATRISGTFETTLTDLNDSSIVIKITAGKIANVKYTVLN